MNNTAFHFQLYPANFFWQNRESYVQLKQLSLNFHLACYSVFNGDKFVRVWYVNWWTIVLIWQYLYTDSQLFVIFTSTQVCYLLCVYIVYCMIRMYHITPLLFVSGCNVLGRLILVSLLSVSIINMNLSPISYYHPDQLKREPPPYWSAVYAQSCRDQCQPKRGRNRQSPLLIHKMVSIKLLFGLFLRVATLYIGSRETVHCLSTLMGTSITVRKRNYFYYINPIALKVWLNR